METVLQVTLKQRLEAIMQALNMNTRAFAVNMGQPYSKVYDIMREKTQTLSPVLRKAIRETYNVSELYLLTGQGSIFVGQTTSPDLDAMTEAFKRVISTLNEENNLLKKEIEELRARLKEMK